MNVLGGDFRCGNARRVLARNFEGEGRQCAERVVRGPCFRRNGAVLGKLAWERALGWAMPVWTPCELLAPGFGVSTQPKNMGSTRCFCCNRAWGAQSLLAFFLWDGFLRALARFYNEGNTAKESSTWTIFRFSSFMGLWMGRVSGGAGGPAFVDWHIRAVVSMGERCSIRTGEGAGGGAAVS